MSDRFSKIQLPRFLLRLALMALVGSTAVQAADLPRLGEYRVPERNAELPRPIPVQDRNDQVQSLVGIEAGMLRFTYPNIPDAEISVPLSDPGIYFSLLIDDQRKNIWSDSANGRFDAVLEALDPIGEGLLQVADLPLQQSNLSSVAALYYRALVAAAPVERAADLTMRMPVDGLPEVFHQTTEQLVLRAIAEGNTSAAERLLTRLQASLFEDEFAEFAFTAADLLRTSGDQDLAAKLYGTVATSEDEELRQRSLLWAVYTYAVLENAAAAESLLDQLQEPEWGSANFAQYCLARGRLAMLDEQWQNAISFISRAMVLTPVDASFKPELYYLMSKVYESSGDEEASRRLIREFRIFYPASPWLQRALGHAPESSPVSSL